MHAEEALGRSSRFEPLCHSPINRNPNSLSSAGTYMLDPDDFAGMMLHNGAERIFQDLSCSI